MIRQMPRMEALYSKWGAFKAQIKALQADPSTIKPANEVCGGSQDAVRISRLGQLKTLVCEAMREGVSEIREMA